MPGLHRAYAFLHVKAVDGEQRIITGTATTPTPDRMGDIIEPLGVSFTNPLPLLLYHNSQKPVGWVRFFPPTDKGIDFEAKLPIVEDVGTVRERIEEAWTSIKIGLLAGISIGFRPLEEAFNKATNGLRYLKSEVLELSLVAIPAQPDARIATIKSLDVGLAASGTAPGVPAHHPPGASGTRVVKAHTERPMKSYADQIASFEATRQAKNARIDAIMESVADTSSTLDAAQKEEHDGLVEDLKEIDDHLKRLADAQTRAKAAAKPVAGATEEQAAASRAGQTQVITVKPRTEPGIEFARYAMCLASAKGYPSAALEIAKERYRDETRIHQILKAAVAAGTTSDAAWAGSLVAYQDFAGDFLEYLRPQTIIGKFGQNGIPSLNRVPFNIRVGSQTSGGAGYWVGEGKPKPLTKFNFTTLTMGWAKVANIAVLTEEEVRFSSPSAEAKVRKALGDALIERLDIDFIDPAKAAVVGVSPASITNGVAAIPGSGTTGDAFRADFKKAMQTFISANVAPSSLVLIMSTSMALSLSLMRTATGVKEFPDLTMKGGVLDGMSVITSEYVSQVSAGSPKTQMIIFANADEIYLADDGQVVIDASREASLEMLDSALIQDGTTGTGAALVSLWQSNLLGLKAERFINWKVRRPQAVTYISPAAYA